MVLFCDMITGTRGRWQFIPAIGIVPSYNDGEQPMTKETLCNLEHSISWQVLPTPCKSFICGVLYDIGCTGKIPV
jgi:hypothetical protein